MPDIRGGIDYDALSPLRGVASSGSTTSLIDDSLDMEANIHQNGTIRIWIGGKMYERTIDSNDANTFNFSEIGVSVSEGTEYQVIG